MKNAPAIPARKSSFVTWLSMSIAFVIQVKPDHAHQTSASTSAARAKPAALVFERRSSVTWVIANTNTRSKKSSR